MDIKACEEKKNEIYKKQQRSKKNKKNNTIPTKSFGG